jgi:hypothetical protein
MQRFSVPAATGSVIGKNTAPTPAIEVPFDGSTQVVTSLEKGKRKVLLLVFVTAVAFGLADPLGMTTGIIIAANGVPIATHGGVAGEEQSRAATTCPASPSPATRAALLTRLGRRRVGETGSLSGKAHRRRDGADGLRAE